MLRVLAANFTDLFAETLSELNLLIEAVPLNDYPTRIGGLSRKI